jgi:hypothetical protein
MVGQSDWKEKMNMCEHIAGNLTIVPDDFEYSPFAQEGGRQSFTKISCVMRTAEMTSRSFLADFWLDGDEQVRMLGYCYHSLPLPTVQHRSQPHDGTVVFEVVGTPVTKLKGTYWTGRKTTGEVVLTFRGEERLDEFPTDLGRHPVSGKS